MVARAWPGPSGPLLACWGKALLAVPSAVPEDALSLGLCLEPGSCHWVLAFPASCITTSLPALGGLGTLPWRGCWWVLSYETWYLNGLFIMSAPSGCQALSHAGHIAVNETDAVAAPGVGGVWGAGFPVGETDENQVSKQKIILLMIKMIG